LINSIVVAAAAAEVTALTKVFCPLLPLFPLLIPFH